MKRIPLLILVLFVLAVMPACKKKKSDSCSSEPAISVTTIPANGTTEAPAPGPTFPLQVTINSALPPGGVTIEVKAHQEGQSTNFYSTSTTSASKDNSFTISGTPKSVTCVVEITVSSRNCSNNKWSGNYRYSMK
ncbi:MAG TPA: hypothetical protein VFS31_12115 [Chitinophagaceae bacterium]|nr:hypothetical protein [Chitinophagaceae bacterium]